ncbi:hypothetical protein [Mycobacterium sp. OTB74]|uniref:hypothetical protein n=1 Tax=Mycobacterium sp. OTB74 TaxID=1853452 RepID=UPI00247504B5|nr:hypothetical protein [Mycobacterium sp. OTB74]MDH6246838.1 hypothetical protein [Mycobacterium sp. OTB74]
MSSGAGSPHEASDAGTIDEEIVAVHNCSRIGLQASPPRSWLPGWLTPRRGN